MSEKPAEIIQTLREADEQSKATIDAARKERDSRLKQAAVEAEAEIAEYRATRDREYHAEMDKSKGSTGDASKKIATDAQKNIERTLASAAGKKAAVVDMLVGYVKDVRTGA